MNLKALLVLIALLAAGTTLAPRAMARNGADDPADHDDGDDHDGAHDDGDDDGDDHGDDGDDHGDDDGDDSGEDEDGEGNSHSSSGSWVRTRTYLLRDAASPDADARGTIEVRTRDSRQRFKVEVEHLDPSASVEVLVADGTGTPVTAGSLVADTEGEAELELDTGDGASLPAGATTVADLAGRRVEVRDGSGALLLAGTVPSLDGSTPAGLTASSKVKDSDSGVRATTRMKVSRRSGRQEFRLEVKKAGRGASVELLVDDGNGNMVLVETLDASRSGRARLRLDSRKGNGMPLGVLGLTDLSGRAFHLRVEGVTVASGNLPSL